MKLQSILLVSVAFDSHFYLASSEPTTNSSIFFPNIFHDDEKYPDCDIPAEYHYRIGDGVCDDENDSLLPYHWNTPICGFDGGDCIPGVGNLEEDYPECIPQLIKLGYGSERICSSDDGSSSSSSSSSSSIEGKTRCFTANDRCDESVFAIEACGYEFGECPEYEEKYAGCNVPPSWLGDGICQEDANRKECLWDEGDCDISTINSSLYIVMGGAVILVSIIFNACRIFRRHDRWSDDDMDQTIRTEDKKQDPEARRKSVLSGIIQMKILSFQHGIRIVGTDEDDISNTTNDEDDSTTTADASLKLTPHRIADEETGDGSQGGGSPTTIIQFMKDGVYLEGLIPLPTTKFDMNITAVTIPAGGEDNQIDDDDDARDESSSSNVSYFPKSCPICFENYREGDDIAWSYNEGCTHSFHRDCIVQWLMSHDECPMCRSSYLVKPIDQNAKDCSNDEEEEEETTTSR